MQDADAEQVEVGAADICRLIILILLTVLSTGPELCRRVSPAVTASMSGSSPLAKDLGAGEPSVRTVAIQERSSGPCR